MEIINQKIIRMEMVKVKGLLKLRKILRKKLRIESYKRKG
jgi:hypothetical protein